MNIVRRQSTRSATREKHPNTSSELPSNNSIPQKSQKSTSEAKKVVPQEWVGSEKRRGWQERINEAIKENRVIDYNKEKRTDLSVIAQHTRLGNITDSSLKTSISEFHKKVKGLKVSNEVSSLKD